MIYSAVLNESLIEQGLQEQSDILQEYLEQTFLRPNDLNCNPISKSYIRDHKLFLLELRNALNSEDITSDLEQLFLTLLSKNNPIINRNILLVSRTKFLQSILATFVLGFMLETNTPI